MIDESLRGAQREKRKHITFSGTFCNKRREVDDGTECFCKLFEITLMVSG